MKVRSLIIAVALAGAMGMLSTGCNTVRGAGRDIQKGGQVVERAADKTQRGAHRAADRH